MAKKGKQVEVEQDEAVEVGTDERTAKALERIADVLERWDRRFPGGTLNAPTGPIAAREPVGTLREEQAKLAEELEKAGLPAEKLKAAAAKPEPAPKAPEPHKPDPLAALVGDAEPEPEARKVTFEQARTALVTAAQAIGPEKVGGVIKSVLGVERLSAAPKDEEAYGRFVTALEALAKRPLVKE